MFLLCFNSKTGLTDQLLMLDDEGFVKGSLFVYDLYIFALLSQSNVKRLLHIYAGFCVLANFLLE